MKVLFLITLIVIATVFAIRPFSEDEVMEQFTNFMVKYNRRYSSQEQTKQKYAIFKQNLQKIRLENFINRNAVYDVTEFMDMTPEEFAKKMLTKIPYKAKTFQKTKFAEIKRDLPENFNWTDKGVVTKVKNQGSCGSCWAFSAIGNVESVWKIGNHDLVELSEQQLVDCDHECDPDDPSSCDAGCNGGMMHTAYMWIIKNKGIASEKDYPYKGYDQKCKTGIKSTAVISSWEKLGTDETIMESYLYAHAPLAVALNANSLQFYSKGILDPSKCDPAGLNHGVMITGWGVEKGKPYWVVKNSWGASWGEHGYFRIARGKGTCGINTFVVTAKL